MSRIFLSHSSHNNREALALKIWLESQGWKYDVFLDLDPVSGLKTGTRWKDALIQANLRCEAIICLISPEWINSPECVAEYRTAENIQKKIFVAKIAELDSPDKTREWQGCSLFGDGPMTEISLGSQHQPVRFVTEGLARLRNGLLEAGISGVLPLHFPWPPKDQPMREPFRGLEPLEFEDAGVYFGRDTEILLGLAELKRMRLAGDVPIFVILGASGSGKSSFLRAGLAPRLYRDDRNFFPLKIIRPGCNPLFGAHGLAHAISMANRQLKLVPVNSGDVKTVLKKGVKHFAALMCNIQNAVRAQILGLPEDSQPPTLVLQVDQAEELFNTDATSEARTFLSLIGSVMRGGTCNTEVPHVPMIVVFTIRSDSYEPLQAAAELDGLKTVVFDALKPMPPTQFKEVITGPASRALVDGRPLEVKPGLVSQLLDECANSADALPLLSLTLSRLYRDYGSNGDLKLEKYLDMGGMADVIKSEAESILDSDSDMRKAQLETLHTAFIPWLATINVDNNQPMRRVASMSDLPKDSHQLVYTLIEKRLLLSDLRNGEQVVEIAHESLLRQWEVLAEWLDKERNDLKEADRLEHDAKAWMENGKKDAWLREGERLGIGKTLASKPSYRKRLESVSEFLLASHQREAQRHKEEERVRQAEIFAAQEKQVAAEALAVEQQRATERAQADAARLEKSRNQLLSIVLMNEAQAMLSGALHGGTVLGLLKLLAAYRIAPHAAIDGTILAQLVTFKNVEKIIDAGSAVCCVAFSPDGNRLVCASEDYTLRLWDAKDGLPLGTTLCGHDGWVTSMAFSPDGTRFVSASYDETLRLWDAQTGLSMGEPLRGHEGPVTSVTFSPDGTIIVSGSEDNSLMLWNAQTGQSIGAPLRGHEGPVTGVSFSRDGYCLASSSMDNTLRMWDIQTGQSIGIPLKGPEGFAGIAAINPDCARVISGNSDGTMLLWNTQTGERIGASLEGNYIHGVTKVAFSPDGTLLVSGSSDKKLRLWDAQFGNSNSALLQGHHGGVTSVAFSPDGIRLVSGSDDKTLMIWNVQADQFIGEPLWGHELYGNCVSVAFSPDGTHLASASSDKTLRLWDAQTCQTIGAPLLGHEGRVTSVAFSPDGTRLVSGSNDKTLRLWDAQTCQPIGEPLQGHEDRVTSVAFSPDGTRLVSGSDDKTLRLWDAQACQPIGKPLQGHEDKVTSVAFSPDGTRLVSGSEDETLRFWNAQTGQSIGAPLWGHEGGVTSVAFSPDGSRLASGGIDKALRLWNTETGQHIGAPLQGHKSIVTSVAFSPCGTNLASGGGHFDGTLRLWNVQSGQSIGAPLHGPEGGVGSVAFSSDGLRLASGNWDGSLQFWPAPKAWLDLLCMKLTHNMSRKEWREQVSPDIEYREQCPGLPISADVSTQELPFAAGREAT